jgi:diguanylate cyclase (GGDEF)-like protein/PAS domain S-box-containing protein
LGQEDKSLPIAMAIADRPLSLTSLRTEGPVVDAIDETARLSALDELGLLDTPQEQEFDDIVRLASAICQTPISLVSLVDKHRQWFKASQGLDRRETPIELSFCAHAIRQEGLFVVEDASQDLRFRDNLLVNDSPGIRFYAGIPLHAPNGCAVGTLCVIDQVPRRLSAHQREALRILGTQVEARMELRLKQRQIEQSAAENAKLYEDLRSTTDLFERFMDHGPFASYIKDVHGRIIYYNKFLAERFGVTRQAWIGLHDHEIWPPQVAEQFRRHDIAVMEGGTPVEIDEITPSRNGGREFWKSLKFPYHRANGELMLAGMSVDVTAQMMREAELLDALREKSELAGQLEASKHLLQKFMENSPNTTFVKDHRGRYVFYNGSFADHLGISQTEWLGRSDDELFPKEVAEKYIAQDQLVINSGQTLEFFDQAEDAKGELRRFRSLKFTYKGLDGRNLLGGVTVDVTEQLKREEALADANLKLEALATTDSMTGLATRRVFESRAAIEFEVARRKQRPLSILLMDIDDFKRRNDEFGHAEGDRALKILGRVLKSCARVGDVAARLGGEEFGCLLPDTDGEAAMVFAQRLQSALRLAPQGPLPLTVSVGVACTTERMHSWERLLGCADDAMYAAKRAGKDRAVNHDGRSPT